VKGKLATRPHGVRDAFEQVPVERMEYLHREDEAKAAGASGR
jgi:hypothetical protein